MDKELYIKAKLGDIESKERVIKNFEGLIIKLCNYYNLKGYSFEDLKQIAYLSIIDGLEKISIDNIETAPAYIIVCIKNSLRNEARKILNKPDLNSLNEVTESGNEYIDLIESDYCIEDEFLTKLDKEKAVKGYNSLTTEEKNIISYYIMNPYGGLKEYASLYNENYRKVRYTKDCIIKKLKNIIFQNA